MTDSNILDHWINGGLSAGTGTRTGDVYDPAKGIVQKQVRFASASDVDTAVDAAAKAFTEWGQTSIAKRMQVMFAFRELLNARKDELAQILTAEHGKVLSDAAGEIARGLEVVEFACSMPHLIKGAMSEQVSTDVDVYSVKQPLGVVGIISPFNFPAMVPMWFFPIAIATGNTVVLKPSEKDPSAANWMAALMTEAVAINAGRAKLEASRGLTLDVAREVAATGVDYLAVGALTHSAPVLDIAMDLRVNP